jgi:glycosyltransferase involved in cell wall biosynthesis
MRDQVNTKNLKILIISPGSGFSTLERKSVADCQYLRDIGGNPVLYCLKDSLIDKSADKLSLPRLYFKGQSKNRFYMFKFLADLRSIIKTQEFDLVHCYHFKSLWPACISLLRYPKIPLFLTVNDFLNKPVTDLIRKWLIKRVDAVLTFSESTKIIANTALPISNRKIKNIGVGVENYYQYQIQENTERVIGSIITSETEFDNLRTIIFTINPLKEQIKDLNLSIKLIIFSAKPIKDYYGYSELQKYIEELGVQDNIIFSTLNDVTTAIKNMDLLVSTSFYEPFSDIEITGILSKLPLVIPRTAARQNILNKYQGFTKSFYFQDARELRKHILDILINQTSYLSKLEEVFDEISNHHGFEHYIERIHGEYEKAVKKRIRYSTFKEKVN